MKKQLLMEELRRQRKKPKYSIWVLIGAVLLIVIFTSAWWYRTNLDDILETKYQKGLALKSAGEYRMSNEVLLELYDEQPQFRRTPQALYEAAETLDLYLAQYRDSLLTYFLLRRDYPETEQASQAKRQIAIIYKYRLDDCGQAIAAYQDVLDMNPLDGAEMQYEVADCYFRLNNFEQARIEFESLQKKYPESSLNGEVQYRIAMTYVLEGLLPEAEAAYRLVEEQWPDSNYVLEARYGLASVLEDQEELKEALKILEDLVGEYPNVEALNRKIEQVKTRIDKKKKAI